MKTTPNKERRDFFKSSGNKLGTFLETSFGVGQVLGGFLKEAFSDKEVENSKRVRFLKEKEPLNTKGVGLSGAITCIFSLDWISYSTQKRQLLFLGHDQNLKSKALFTVLDCVERKHLVSSAHNMVFEGGEQIPVYDEFCEGSYFVDSTQASARFFLKTPWNSVLLFENWCCEIFPERSIALRCGAVGRIGEIEDAILWTEPGQRVKLYMLSHQGEVFRFESKNNFSRIDMPHNQNLLKQGVLENISSFPETEEIRKKYFSLKNKNHLASGAFEVVTLGDKTQEVFVS